MWHFLLTFHCLFYQVGADDSAVLDKIVDTLTSIAKLKQDHRTPNGKSNLFAMKVGEVKDSCVESGYSSKKKNTVLVLGAGRVCQPAVELLASIGSNSSPDWIKSCGIGEFEEQNSIQVIVASLFLKDAEEVHSIMDFFGI